MPLVTYAVPRIGGHNILCCENICSAVYRTCYLSNQLRLQLPHESVMEQSDKRGGAATKMRSPRQQPAFVTELNENDVL